MVDLEKVRRPYCGKVGGHEIMEKSDDPDLLWYDLRCKCGSRFVVEK